MSEHAGQPAGRSALGERAAAGPSTAGRAAAEWPAGERWGGEGWGEPLDGSWESGGPAGATARSEGRAPEPASGSGEERPRPREQQQPKAPPAQVAAVRGAPRHRARVRHGAVQPVRPGTPRRAFDALVVAWGWVAFALMLEAGPVAARLLLVLVFVGFGPGLAMRRWLPARSGLETFVTAIAASLSLGVLVTLALALGHAETGARAFAVLAGMTTLAALVDSVRRLPRRPVETRTDAGS
jgi:hypothetical protein